jgi:hypothetical protein
VCARQALAATRRGGFAGLVATASTALAEVHLAHGQPEQAADVARQALAAHRDCAQRLTEARTLLVLDHAVRDTCGTDAAAACRREARDLFTDLGSPEAARASELLRPADRLAS